MFSKNLRAVNWHRRIRFSIADGHRRAGAARAAGDPARAVASVVAKFIDFSDAGAQFVFGNLAKPGDIALNPGVEFLFIFAFKALPPFCSSRVLHRAVSLASFSSSYDGPRDGLSWHERLETLSAAVFMGRPGPR